MIGVVEGVALVLVACVLADASMSFVGALRRRTQQTRANDMSLQLFRDLAEQVLRSARAERERNELSWNGLRKFRVDEKVEEAAGICSFYLRPHDGHPVPPFLPGQHLTFQLRIPGRPEPAVRCYSLSDQPGDSDRYRVTIKRIRGGASAGSPADGLVSSYFHDTLRVGDTIDVRAPGGTFHLDPQAHRPVVLVAGGIGITPLLSMLNTITGVGAMRETRLYYAVRDRTEHVMYDHLKQLELDHPDVSVHVVYSNPTPQCRAGEDYQSKGRVDVALLARELPSSNYAFYLCGPPPMMEQLSRGLEDWGVPGEDIHFEAFGPKSVERMRTPAPEVPDPGYEVEFARSGKTARWTDTSQNLLDLAESCGVSLPFGCRGGSCGTCATAIKDGEVEYQIAPELDPGQGSCLACVATPKGKLVLDA